MSKISVVAKVVAKSGAVEKVKAELVKLVETTRTEQGCIEYRLHQDLDDPRVFAFYENWESLPCLDRHLASPHFKEYLAAVDGLIAEKSVHKMAEIG